ncbi:MAG: polyamine ABC transporter substrate-binding protein [Micrococcales bacterium 73-13]|nr:MAG: polyamine ABC transporter substrate-binding protein [Micrococcales bacterium 73-13]
MVRPLPEDPMLRELVVRARSFQFNRRRFLQGVGVTAASAGALSLAACAPGDELVWANWDGYMDTDDAGNYPTLDAFQKQTGITVKYRVDIDDNDTFYASIKDQLALGQFTGYDVACLTDWMVAQMIESGYALELDAASIPNRKNLNPSLEDVDYDPGRKYSLTWQSGYAGLVYDEKAVPGGISTVEELWDPAFKGKVVVLSELRDTIGVIMASQGVDIASNWGSDDFYAALDVVQREVSNGQIASIKGNSYTDDLLNGDAVVGIVWSGDVKSILNAELEAAGEQARFKFVIPDTGGTLWSDNFISLLGSKKNDKTAQLINYYYDPEVAAELAAWVNYITPVMGAQEAMRSIAPELADDPLIFPTEEDLAKVKMFRTLSPTESKEFSEAWVAVNVGA